MPEGWSFHMLRLRQEEPRRPPFRTNLIHAGGIRGAARRRATWSGRATGSVTSPKLVDANSLSSNENQVAGATAETDRCRVRPMVRPLGFEPRASGLGEHRHSYQPAAIRHFSHGSRLRSLAGPWMGSAFRTSVDPDHARPRCDPMGPAWTCWVMQPSWTRHRHPWA
jgi:hypothetical protein